MTISELRARVSKVGFDVLKTYLQGEGCEVSENKLSEAIGLPFEWVGDFRSAGCGDFDGWTYRWKIGDKFYETEGSYSSYGGVELDSYDVERFYEVRPVEKTVIVWEKVK